MWRLNRTLKGSGKSAHGEKTKKKSTDRKGEAVRIGKEGPENNGL